MRVIAVDPGYDRLGIAVMEKENNQEKLLFSTCIQTNKKDPLPQRIMEMGLEFEKLVNEYEPNILAIETLFFNKNQKTALQVAEARGVIIYIGKKKDCLIREFGPKEVKVAVTGYGASDKKAVMDMLKRLISDLPEKALDDEYDAIAVATTALAHERY